MSSHKILIVEDEALIALDIELRLGKMGFEVSGIVHKPNDVQKTLGKVKTDLVLLDINLKGKEEGIDLAEIIQTEYNLPVVFLTAHGDTHTFKKALKSDPYGYMTKPFKDKDLKHAIEIALVKHKEISEKRGDVIQYRQILSNVTAKSTDVNSQSLFVKEGSSYKQVKLDDILWIEAYDNYSKIYCHDQKLIVNALLKDLYTKLPPGSFQRVHRSYVVALKKIDKIDKDHLTIANHDIPISRSFRKELMGNLGVV